MRGVTPIPSTLASIQVRAQPGCPWRSSPSAGSTPMPYRVPSTCAFATPSSTGIVAAARSRSPVAATWRSTAWANHSVASAVLASIPSEAVAAYPRSSARPRRPDRWSGNTPRRRSWCRATTPRTTGSPRRRRGAVVTNASAASTRRAATSSVGPRSSPACAPLAGGCHYADHRRRLGREIAGPGRHRQRAARGIQVSGEPAGRPHVLVSVEAALRLQPRARRGTAARWRSARRARHARSPTFPASGAPGRPREAGAPPPATRGRGASPIRPITPSASEVHTAGPKAMCREVVTTTQCPLDGRT